MSEEAVWPPGRKRWGGGEELRGEDVGRDAGAWLRGERKGEGLNLCSVVQHGRRREDKLFWFSFTTACSS